MKLCELLKVMDYRIPIRIFVNGEGYIGGRGYGEGTLDSSSEKLKPYLNNNVINIEHEEDYPYFDLLITLEAS